MILSPSRSNCDSDIRVELRRHYSKPYFIPSDSEHSETDWIFMGGVGPGANIHVSMLESLKSSALHIIIPGTLYNYFWDDNLAAIF